MTSEPRKSSLYDNGTESTIPGFSRRILTSVRYTDKLFARASDVLICAWTRDKPSWWSTRELANLRTFSNSFRSSYFCFPSWVGIAYFLKWKILDEVWRKAAQVREFEASVNRHAWMLYSVFEEFKLLRYIFRAQTLFKTVFRSSFTDFS